MEAERTGRGKTREAEKRKQRVIEAQPTQGGRGKKKKEDKPCTKKKF